MASLAWHGNGRPPWVEWHNRSAELLHHLAACDIVGANNEGAVRGLIAQLGPGRKRTMLTRTQQRPDCETTGTVTAKHCRHLSGQPRLLVTCDEADLGVCEAPAARASNAGPDSATMIDSSGDPISGRGVGCWRLMSIQAGGCMLTAVHLRRDRRKEQQQQLASYMTEHDGDVVGFGDTRLGENAGIMDRLTKRAMTERREKRQR